jgi:DNA-binding CsgD family transcriptional regulator/PAS domain-containing protein
MSRDRLLTIIGKIYDSAEDETLWTECLSSMGSLLHGTSTNLIYHHYRHLSLGSLDVAIGADPELYRWYREYGQSIDPWGRSIRPDQFPIGSVVIGASVIDHASFARTEFYAAMGRRHRTTRVIAGVLECSPQHIGVIAVNRGDEGAEFDTREARLFGVLVPHVRRALGIRRRMRRLASERASLVDAMEAANLGIILVDERARPVFANRYAARLLAAGDGLSIDKEWWAATPQATKRLRTSLAQAIAVTKRSSLETGEMVIALPRQSGPPLRAAITPVSRHNRLVNAPGRASAIAFLVDPALTPVAPAERLAGLFALTPAEAGVAALFAAARTTLEISGELGITRETVRTHVKRVLAKSGATTQAQFVHLVATGVAPLAVADADQRR